MNQLNTWCHQLVTPAELGTAVVAVPAGRMGGSVSGQIPLPSCQILQLPPEAVPPVEDCCAGVIVASTLINIKLANIIVICCFIVFLLLSCSDCK